jgi:hypothetical protein
MKFEDVIKTSRNGSPRSKNTITTYKYDWKNAIKLFFPNEKNIDINNDKFLNILDFKISKIKKKIQEIKKIRQRKRILNIIEILAFDLDRPRVDVKKLVLAINKEIQDEEDKNVKSSKEKENWITPEEYDEILNEYEKEVNSLIKKKKIDTYFGRQKLQNLIIYKFYREHHLRNDIARLKVISNKNYKKIEDDDDDKTNYIIVDSRNCYVILNEYKTFKFTNEAKIEISKELANLIRKYLKIQKSGYLLVNGENKPFTRGTFSVYFIRTSKKIFGKSFGTSLLRHIAITNKTKDMNLSERRKLAREMLHGVGTQLVYYKND